MRQKICKVEKKTLKKNILMWKIVGGMDEKVKQITSILLTKIKNNMQCYIEKVVWKIDGLKRIFL